MISLAKYIFLGCELVTAAYIKLQNTLNIKNNKCLKPNTSKSFHIHMNIVSTAVSGYIILTMNSYSS